MVMESGDAMAVETPPVKSPPPRETLEEIRVAMEEIAAKMLFVKREGRPKSELRELITQMSLLFISLRQVNREILMEEDRIKGETESAKAPVDLTTLQLHNLMYEKNHYAKAIKACKDFKSKNPNIELVPEEEFFRSAPEDIKGKVLASDASHDLMLKRLHFELFQRKELCKLREKLEQRRKSLSDTIASRRKFLSSLPSHLKSLKKASLPVQQQFGILHSKKLKQHSAAELLPLPLYIVYSQVLAQKEAFGEKIEIEILGSLKDAQTFAQQQAKKENGTLANTESSRMEDDAPDEEEDIQRRRKKSKKNLVLENMDQAGVYQSHPLKVFLHIYNDEDTDGKPLKLITLKFEYLLKLKVVCVGVEDSMERSDDNILCNLFPDDTGLELPHQVAKLYAEDFVSFGAKRNTHPYKWAQHLAGMDILPEVPPLHANLGVANNGASNGPDVTSGLSLYRHQNRVQMVVQRIRSRKKAQLALLEQLDSLMKLKWPLLSYKNVPWALHTPSCIFRHWSPSRIPDSSSLCAIAVETADSGGLDIDRRSVTSMEEVEPTREDGELPLALPLAAMPGNSKVSISRSSKHEHGRSLVLMSKSILPSKKVKSQFLRKDEDDFDLMVESESDVEEHIDSEMENGGIYVNKPWEEHAAREFHLVLSRRNRSEEIVKLEAKVTISIEYPLRPPLFSLCILTDGPQGHLDWSNDLRAMEAEVNLHILKILPSDCKNSILAHQIYCLAMLFDFQFDTYEKRRSTSVVDVGLCEPVSGAIVARSFRGRDRRKMFSWKGMDCTPGYPN